MFFLLRVAFWLSIVLVLLPSGGSTPSKGPGAIEAVSAAGSAVSDLGQFCGRQPDACVVGAQAAAAFGQRAQAGAKMVYDFLSEKVAHADKTGDKSETGSVRPIPATKASQQTLKPADVAPTWRGPRKDKDAATRHPA